MSLKYQINIQKIGDTIIGFSITVRNFRRSYPIYLSNELETPEEFISRKTKEFLDEIKYYRKVYHLTNI